MTLCPRNSERVWSGWRKNSFLKKKIKYPFLRDSVLSYLFRRNTYLFLKQKFERRRATFVIEKQLWETYICRRCAKRIADLSRESLPPFLFRSRKSKESRRTEASYPYPEVEGCRRLDFIRGDTSNCRLWRATGRRRTEIIQKSKERERERRKGGKKKAKSHWNWKRGEEKTPRESQLLLM